MTDLHEQLHASLRISAFASLLCASVKYSPLSILELLLLLSKQQKLQTTWNYTFSGAAIPNI